MESIVKDGRLLQLIDRRFVNGMMNRGRGRGRGGGWRCMMMMSGCDLRRCLSIVLRCWSGLKVCFDLFQLFGLDLLSQLVEG